MLISDRFSQKTSLNTIDSDTVVQKGVHLLHFVCTESGGRDVNVRCETVQPSTQGQYVSK